MLDMQYITDIYCPNVYTIYTASYKYVKKKKKNIAGNVINSVIIVRNWVEQSHWQKRVFLAAAHEDEMKEWGNPNLPKLPGNESFSTN